MARKRVAADKEELMIGFHNKMPFASLIYSKRINPKLKSLLDSTSRLLKKDEIDNLCKLYQPLEDWEEVQRNMSKLNGMFKNNSGPNY